MLGGDHGHQEAERDRQLVLEATRDQAQAEPKLAEVAAIPPMQPLQPVVAQGTDPQIDDPEIGDVGFGSALAPGWRV